jgi:hypothetical protein
MTEHHCDDPSGCPFCNPELGQVLRDSIAGRWDRVSAWLTARTRRTLRACGIGANHPLALEALGSHAVAPAPPCLQKAIAEARKPQTEDERNANLRKAFSAGISTVRPYERKK